MDAPDIATYTQRLLELQRALDSEDKATEQDRGTVTLDQQSVGRLSRMDAMQQQAMANATHARRQAMQTKIKAALQRIEEGEFGYCAECGEVIAPARLNLDPAILTCVTCAHG